MKRLERLSSQLLISTGAGAAAAAAAAAPCRPATRRISRAAQTCRSTTITTPTTTTKITTNPSSLCSPRGHQIRCQSAAASPEFVPNDDDALPPNPPDAPVDSRSPAPPPPLPSPHPDRAARSAKLAALHARLSLSSKIPPQTLARALVDPSADPHPRFNNANLAWLGSAILQYHVSEWLVAHYPRLPMAINFAAMKGIAGVPALHQVARAWGVEAAAAPGEEVDPGLLQFAADQPTVVMNKWGYVRSEAKEVQKYKFRRGMSSRILYDDAFGEMTLKQKQQQQEEGEGQEGNTTTDKQMLVQDAAQNAHANFVRAVVGAVYLHCGREPAKAFARAHVLSRRLDLAHLFEFRMPVRELVRLCAREGFEPPVARLLSETGRLSRTPVFVVGIYSGRDKLGEHFGPSLDSARTAAAIQALKSWYLYSPGERVPVPSDAFAEEGVAPWKPLYVDIGEIVS